jgi:hypothetical protein
MTDAEEPDPTPAAPRAGARLAAWGWDRVRWLATELTTIVVGILVALAIQNRVDAAKDRASEREYLQQLRADLLETERVVMRSDSIHRPRDRAGVMLLHAFFAPRPPPRDSLVVWAITATWYEPPRPILGTAEALVSTGHLGLIEDHGLRTAITAYLEESRLLTTEHLAVEEVWVRSSQQLRHALDLAEGLELLPSTRLDSLARADPQFYLPSGPRRRPFPFDPDAFLDNRIAYDGVADMYWGKQNMAQLRASMLQGARRLRARVETALAE